ncbi:MAG TPA: MraY family glycosyltransferase [Pyrinomonadaceae bacterium]|nr:MraY family glycosyltransferase [Pyrinomonadaceae bacterium]
MKTYLAIFLIAAFASAVLTPLLRRLCERYRLLDSSLDQRRIHQKAVPRLGGVAIFVSIVLALASIVFLHNGVTQNLRPELKAVAAVLVCGLLVLLLGVYDDIRGANASIKLVSLAAIAVLFYALGGRIDGLSVPFFGQITLHPIFGLGLTVLWVVGIANAFNLIDGVDGLATGSALFSSLVLLTNALIQGNARVVVIALALSGALAGFLRYNFNPASIFLGDSGSLLVGFVLAALSIQGSQKASTAVAVAIPLLAFGLPVVDTGVAIGRRLLSGKPVFEGDREHIHHMLLARGWSQTRVALALYAVSAAFGLAAMLFVNGGTGVPAVVLIVIGVAIALALGNLRYHEVDELRASVRRNLGDRRMRAINNLRIRRACQSLSSATQLNELFAAVVEVCEAGQFACAMAELSCHCEGMVNPRVVEFAREQDSVHGLRISDGRVQWKWERQTRSLPKESSDLWTIRLPVSHADFACGYLSLSRSLSAEPLMFDVNYLTRVFQPAFAKATQRVLAQAEQSRPRQRAAVAAL